MWQYPCLLNKWLRVNYDIANVEIEDHHVIRQKYFQNIFVKNIITIINRKGNKRGLTKMSLKNLVNAARVSLSFYLNRQLPNWVDTQKQNNLQAIDKTVDQYLKFSTESVRRTQKWRH